MIIKKGSSVWTEQSGRLPFFLVDFWHSLQKLRSLIFGEMWFEFIDML